MTRVGLVLGAGGTVGQAYHAGVLAALEQDLGWDPRSADVVAGTSAGAVIGTLLRLGVSAADLAAWAVNAPSSGERGPGHAWLDDGRADAPPLAPRFWLRRPRLPPARLVKRLAGRPWALRPSVVASALLPRGTVDLVDHAVDGEELPADSWPAGLRVCAVRHDDGARVVFGRDHSPTAAVPHAVASSCAIPGCYAPVDIDGDEYVDGGVHSPTNADVVADEGLDLVVVLSPMSAADGLPRTVDGPLRYALRRRLDREVRTLAARGTTVVRVEPAAEALTAMGVNMMATDRAEPVVRAAFLETGRTAAAEPTASRLAPLASRAVRRRAAA